MIRIMAHAFGLALFVLACFSPVMAQNAPFSRSLAVGVDMLRFAPIGTQEVVGATPFVPGLRVGYSKYLRPGYDFRFAGFIAPSLPDPLVGELQESMRLAFHYAVVFKLNNGIILKESARFAPFVLLGAGGSYHAGRPDAYSPLGGGADVRLSGKHVLRIEANRNIGWNRSPQSWHLSLMYVHRFQPQQALIPEEPLTTEDLLAQEAVPDSDNDGVPDTEDACPYDAGLMLYGGCPDPGEPESTITEDTARIVEVSTSEASEDPDPMIAVQPKKEILPIESTQTELSFAPEEEVDQPQQAMPMLEEEQPGLALIAENPKPEVQPYQEETVSPCAPSSDFPTITFSTGSSDLTDAERRQLREVAEQMVQCPDLVLKLEGHANEYRDEDANLVLSIKRAYNIKYYLVYEHRISQQRIISRGAGSRKSDHAVKTVSFSWSF